MADTAAAQRLTKRIMIALAAAIVVMAGRGAAFLFSLAQSFDSATKIEEVFPDDAARPAAPEPAEG